MVKRSKRGTHVDMGIGVAALLVLFVVIPIAFCYHKRRTRRVVPMKKSILLRDMLDAFTGGDHVLKVFDIKELKASTNNLNPKSIIEGSIYPGVVCGSVLAIKETSADVTSKDVTSLPSKAVEDDVSDAGTGHNEEVELELENPLETSFDECSNQKEKPSVLSPEEANKLKEAAVMAKAEQVPKAIVEESVEVPVGDKNDGLIVTPLVQNEAADTCQELQLSDDNFHAQETTGDRDIDNSSSSDASFPEPTMEVDNVDGIGEEKSETAAIMAETIEAKNPVPVADRDLITGVLESGEEDGVNSCTKLLLEAVEGNSETSLELSVDEEDTPATKEAGVAADQEEDAPAQPLMVATVDNTPQPDLVTGSLSAVEMSSDEKKVMENEKLREMLEQLLEARKQKLGIISDLNGRVKELEKKPSQKKRVRVR